MESLAFEIELFCVVSFPFIVGFFILLAKIFEPFRFLKLINYLFICDVTQPLIFTFEALLNNV